MCLVSIKQLFKAVVNNMLFPPETEKDTQSRHYIDLVRRMRGDKGQDIFLCNGRHMLDVTLIQMHKELTQIQTIVLDGDHVAAQVCQMGYQFLHLCPNLPIEGMEHRCKATFADVAELQHIVKHLNAPYLLTFLWTYCAMKMAG